MVLGVNIKPLLGQRKIIGIVKDIGPKENFPLRPFDKD
jgi:hypothetical protein